MGRIAGDKTRTPVTLEPERADSLWWRSSSLEREGVLAVLHSLFLEELFRALLLQTTHSMLFLDHALAQLLLLGSFLAVARDASIDGHHRHAILERAIAIGLIIVPILEAPTTFLLPAPTAFRHQQSRVVVQGRVCAHDRLAIPLRLGTILVTEPGEHLVLVKIVLLFRVRSTIVAVLTSLFAGCSLGFSSGTASRERAGLSVGRRCANLLRPVLVLLLGREKLANQNFHVLGILVEHATDSLIVDSRLELANLVVVVLGKHPFKVLVNLALWPSAGDSVEDVFEIKLLFAVKLLVLGIL
mmetsp:Transcript_6762/g.17285  ORF Transcript_6762/g.17285 Transcript_6762/m.17285 type:complete len:300 (+) Transcript_6762:175-1074(+)